MAEIIDGKKISIKLKEKVKKEVYLLKEKKISVCLAVVLVGKDPASKIYVKNKKLTCEELGIVSREILLDEKITQEDLIEIIKKLNSDVFVNGILVQLPLPKHINEKEIINIIDPLKDVDCFNVKNVGKILTDDFGFLPCTPAGVVDLIESTKVEITGKNCTIIGRSNIVGKPLFMLMLKKNATVSICHSKTFDLKWHTKNADILIAAMGRPNFVKKDMVKKNAIVIDVGINRLDSGKIVGDVDFDDVFDVASYITPVPGGVGPMTIAKLMQNTLIAAKLQNGIFN